MSEILTCAKIIGHGADGESYQPETDALKWRMIEETESEMTIEILDDEQEFALRQL